MADDLKKICFIDNKESIIEEAKRENHLAEFLLGRMYSNGDGVPKNEKEQLYWLEKAEQGGNSDAMNNLGMLFNEEKSAITIRLMPINIIKKELNWGMKEPF